MLPPDARLQYFVVAFIDIMGQKEKLTRLKAAALNGRDLPAALQLLKETLGAVLSTREEFTTTLERQREFKIRDPATVPPVFQHLSNLHLDFFTYAFGDMFVLAVPIDEEQRWPDQVASVHTVMLTAGARSLYALAHGYALRGAVDFGLGCRLSNDELWGPVVADAYQLEANVADPPRLVVGNGLIGFLDEILNRPDSSPDILLAKNFVNRCRQLYFKDSDDQLVLDYLGEKFIPQEDKAGKLREWAEEASSFVNREQARFENDGDSRLQKRYRRLSAYFDSRRTLWEPKAEAG